LKDKDKHVRGWAKERATRADRHDLLLKSRSMK